MSLKDLLEDFKFLSLNEYMIFDLTVVKIEIKVNFNNVYINFSNDLYYGDNCRIKLQYSEFNRFKEKLNEFLPLMTKLEYLSILTTSYNNKHKKTLYNGLYKSPKSLKTIETHNISSYKKINRQFLTNVKEIKINDEVSIFDLYILDNFYDCLHRPDAEYIIDNFDTDYEFIDLFYELDDDNRELFCNIGFDILLYC